MENTHENTHLIDTQEKDMKNTEVEIEELYEDTNDYFTTEEELGHIHPDLNHNFPYPKINSGIMSINCNKTFHPTTIKVSNAQMDVLSNSYLFTNITIFTYIRPVKCNVQILNSRKSPAKRFGFVIIKIPKTNIIIPLQPSYYMLQNTRDIISQTSLKHYSEFRNVITEALR